MHGVEDGMSTIDLDHRRLLRLVLSILAALVFLAAMHPRVWAGTNHTFVLAGSDAYGASDCTGKVEGCRAVVASAWCEAHGYADALAYGRADDVTASIPAVAGTVTATVQPAKADGAKLDMAKLDMAKLDMAKLDPDAYVVTCAD